MKCIQVPKPILWEVWPRVSHLLERSLTKGDDWWTLDTLRGTLETQDDAALFVVADHDGIYAAAAVMIEQKPNGSRQLHFPAFGGREMRAWEHFLTDVEAWAKGRGASEVSVTGRLGLKRVLRKFGFRQTAVILDKAL